MNHWYNNETHKNIVALVYSIIPILYFLYVTKDYQPKFFEVAGFITVSILEIIITYKVIIIIINKLIDKLETYNGFLRNIIIFILNSLCFIAGIIVIMFSSTGNYY